MTFKTYEEYRAAQDRAGAKKLGISAAEFVALRSRAIRRAGQPAKPASPASAAPQKRTYNFKNPFRYKKVTQEEYDRVNGRPRRGR